MKRKTIVLVSVTAPLVLVAAYLWGPSSVPQGQPPLFALTAANFSGFETAFDAEPSVLRVVLLLSPT